MFDRVKLFLGLGPAESYETPTKWWRLALIVVQLVFLVVLVTAGSWGQRALAVVLAAAAMVVLAVGSQWTTNARRR